MTTQLSPATNPLRRLRGQFRLTWAVAAWLVAWPWLSSAQHQITPWPARKPVPPLNLTDLDGQIWRLQDLKGRVVLLNFWATWCEPCLTEMPTLAALAQRQGRDKLVVLAINYREHEQQVRRYDATLTPKLPLLLDRHGESTTMWTGRIFPTTVVIDTLGRPRFSVVGEYDWTSSGAAQLLAPLWDPRPSLDPTLIPRGRP